MTKTRRTKFLLFLEMVDVILELVAAILIIMANKEEH